MEDLLSDLTFPEESTRDILNSYELNKPPSENIKYLSSVKFSREKLLATVNYIKSLTAQYPTIVQRITQRNSRSKINYAGDISIFIHGINPIPCQACDNNYVHTSVVNTDENNLKCFVCNRHSHKACYGGYTEIKIGFHFICAICISNEKEKVDTVEVTLSSDQTTPVEVTHSSDQTPPAITPTQDGAQISLSPTSDSGHIPASQPRTNLEYTDDNEDESDDGSRIRRSPEIQNRVKEKVCPMFLDNICPHGITGRNCSFNHPPTCTRYSKYGEDRYKGCTRGKECYYYHPRLCQNSVAMRLCLNKKTCKDVHLVGTSRGKPRQEHNNSNYRDRQEGRHYNDSNNRDRQQIRESNNTNYRATDNRRARQHNTQSQAQTQMQMWDQPEVNNPENNHKDSNDTDRSNHFLLKYLEEMKSDLEKSLARQVETAVQSRRENQMFYPIVPQMSHQQMLQHAHLQSFQSAQNAQFMNQGTQPAGAIAPQTQEQYVQMQSLPQNQNQYNQQMVQGQKM